MRGWRPGERGPLANLQEMRRASWDEARASVAREVERRKRDGVPLDDDTDWAVEVRATVALEAAIKAGDGAAYRAALESALQRVRGGLRELPAYEPDPRIEGLLVRFRTLSRRAWLTHLGRLERIRKELGSASIDDVERRYALLADLEDAQAVLVRDALVQLQHLVIDGKPWGIFVEDEAVVDLDDLDVLRESGLLDALFGAARDFQALDPEGRVRFGLLPQPTSVSLTAVGARSAGVTSADATAEEFGFAGPSTRATHARGAVSSDDPISSMPSPFGDAPTEGSQALQPMS